MSNGRFVDVLCTAQTGTGKTLAYLVPAVENLLRAEAAQTEEEREKVYYSRPQVLVLLPSRELALQVSSVAKKLSHSAKFSSSVVTSGERKSIQQKNTSRRLDMIIGTPGRVAKCIKNADFFVSRINTVIVDEADTLLDAKMGFRKEIDEILAPIQASAAKRGQPLQMILVAATIKSPLDQVIKKRFGDLRMVSDDQTHRTPSTIQEEFIRVTPENRHTVLREALRARRQKKMKTVVFCRNVASCRSTDHMLREHGFESSCLHGEMPPAARHDSVGQFIEGDSSILVCTDLAARGLHFDDVNHVIMFDFPKSAVDYVHRAGRTGRAGQRGYVTSLVTRYDLTLARTLEDSKRHKNTIKELRTPASSEQSAIPMDKDDAEPRETSGKSFARQAMKKAAGSGTKKLRTHRVRTLRR